MNDLTSTLRAKIERYLEKLTTSVKHTDNSNSGKLLADYYYWKTASTYVGKREKDALKALTDAGFYNEDELNKLPPGDHPITTSKGFLFTVTVTSPVRRLDLNLLSDQLFKKFKVPLASSRTLLEDCKVDTTPQLRKHITEKL